MHFNTWPSIAKTIEQTKPWPSIANFATATNGF